jgi:hypothetical protein
MTRLFGRIVDHSMIVRGQCHGATRYKGGGQCDVLPERSSCLVLDLQREITTNVLGAGLGQHQPVKVKRPGEGQSKWAPGDRLDRETVCREKRMSFGINLDEQIMA